MSARKEKIGFDCPNLAAFTRNLSSMETQFRYAHYNKPQKISNVSVNGCLPSKLYVNQGEERG